MGKRYLLLSEKVFFFARYGKLVLRVYYLKVKFLFSGPRKYKNIYDRCRVACSSLLRKLIL
jgi:hypothetical protein